MRTRDDVRPELASVTPPAGRLFDGIGRTALVAASALAGCAVLVAVGTALSVCWMVHPALSAPAVIALMWVMSRVASKVFSTTPRSH